MKKLVFSSNGFKSLSPRPLLSRAGFFSTETLDPTPPKTKRDTIYSRVSPLGDPRVSIVPVLDQWVEEGNPVKRVELVHTIKQLRVFKRFKHALEISQWMSDRRYLVLSLGDMAVRLDLISKVHGIEQAEKYFDSIPKQSKTFPVYNALLNCYAQRKSVEKAEAVMQQMREMEVTMSPLAYNVLLTLYSKMGQYEKLDALMEEMQEKGVHPDKFTLSIRLSAYIATSDIDGMEKTLWRMSEDPEVIMDWNCYAIAANGYIKAGLIEKGLEMLRSSEELITWKKKRVAYDFLLTMYAAAGRKAELYRIWNLYKSSEKVYNTAYLCMIGSLLKLDEIAGAEKILEEWESGDTTYDFRVPNLLIATYCKKGQLEKAEKLVINATEKGKVPYPNTWDLLASGYTKANQMPMAVKAMKTAFKASRPGWKPNCDTLASILVYLKQQGDVEDANEFVKFLGSGNHLSTDECQRLQDYVDNRTTEIHIKSGMGDDEEINEITSSEMGSDEETNETAKESK